MTELLASLFLFVCLQMGVDYKNIPKPHFEPVNIEQMKILECGIKVRLEDCEMLPAEFVNGKIYYIEDLDYKHSRELSSYIIHQLVHHIQNTKNKINEPNSELEAVKIQELYLDSVEI